MFCMLTACAKIGKKKKTTPKLTNVVLEESAGDLLIFFQKALHRKEFDCVQDWQLPGVDECHKSSRLMNGKQEIAHQTVPETN